MWSGFSSGTVWDMTSLLLAEDLFLLTHDDESGKNSNTTARDNGLAGALLLDLASEGLVGTEGDKLIAVEGTSPHPLLAAAHSRVAASSKPRSPQHWVSRLPRDLSPLTEAVGRSLVERGILAEQRKKTWGLFSSTTWPEVDPAPEVELRRQLRSVLVAGTEPDSRAAQLIALLTALDLVKDVVEKDDRKAADARAKAIRKAAMSSADVSDAVSASVQAVQMAILVAVIVPTVITTTSS